MNFPSTSTSQFSPLNTFDDQTAEAAAALLQIRGSPRTPNIPSIPELSRSFTFPSSAAVIGNSPACMTPNRDDLRYRVLTETTGHSDALLISHSTQSASTSVPTSVPTINAPSPRRKRKRSLGPEPNQIYFPTEKGKATQRTLREEERAKTLNVLENDGVVRCICGLQVDDGFTIQCESCQVWQHAACMRIHPKTVPQVYLCEQCNPRLVDGVRARRALLARLNSQKQAQEKKKQPRRTSSESTSKRGKGTVSVSPQPQQTRPPHSPSPTQFTQAFPPPDQSHVFQINQQPHNPYPIIPATTPAKEEAFSPKTPFVPITDSAFTTPLVPSQQLPAFQSRAILHTLYPRVDNLQLIQCQVCKEMKNQCDHAVSPIITLRTIEAINNDASSWPNQRFFPNVILRPVCDDRSKCKDSGVMSNPTRSAEANSKCVEQDGTPCIKFGFTALREIKAGEEVVLGCEWEGSIFRDSCHAIPIGAPRGQNEDYKPGIFPTISSCRCGISGDSCILNFGDGAYSEASSYPTTRQTELGQILPQVEKKPINVTASTRVPKKPKTPKEIFRKSGSGTTKRRKGSVNGKRTAMPKQETSDVDMDQDVEIDTRSEDLNVKPALESPTTALATLSVRGTSEIPDQPQSVVDAVMKLSTGQEQSSENNLPAIASLRDRRSRASSTSNPMLELPIHSPCVSPIKSIPAPVVSPLLPSSAANADCTAQTMDAAAAESNGSHVCLPVAPVTTEETKKIPMKRLSLADWKISKDKEKQALALKEAQEKAVRDRDSVANPSPSNEGSVIQHSTEVEAVDTVLEEPEAYGATQAGNSGFVNAALRRSPSIDMDVNVTPNVLNASFNRAGEPTITMAAVSAPERMEARIMKMNVETNDEYNAEARPFTSPQVPCYSLHADSGSDPQNTPPSMRNSAVDDPAADDRRSPFESTFEEGEIKSSPPLPSVAQPSLCPSSYSPTQASRPPRSVSGSPPIRPRSNPPRQPPRSTSPLSSQGRSALNGPRRHLSSRPIPSAPRALRGAIPPRHPSSSYRPNNYRSGHPRDTDRYRGPSSSQRFHDSSQQSEITRSWRDAPWRR